MLQIVLVVVAQTQLMSIPLLVGLQLIAPGSIHPRSRRRGEQVRP